MNVDKAGKEFWDASWNSVFDIQPINPRDDSRANLINQKLHTYFQQTLQSKKTDGMELLEIGCARSQWLPYFAQEYKFIVSGLDYSEIGCEQERQILRQANLTGEIVCADLFHPPAPLLNKFDVVISMGVAEHFQDTAAYVQAVARFLKTDGMLITLIPNMTGILGWLQKYLNQAVYNIHVPLTAEALQQAHQRAEIHVQQCNYFLAASFGMCNLNGLVTNTISYKLKRILLAVLARVSPLIWRSESLAGTLLVNQIFATYVICVGTRQ